ncbi:hypothetical protein DTL42_19015 [Bremerella cremea]|uniref:Barstar (barnase inhibitor) domain-containing protein n=1 Tax=Bremerella cremea TaxID=1031537 RepID=A0A368KMB3_9BACT|nr:barstar family protein [Bremerella cremea]RCS43248.1 hypothetical protein DTL42_19015 [Bremerella cremea]
MTEIDRILTSTEPSWLLRTAIERLVLERKLDRLRADLGFVAVLLDARMMKTVNGVFKEFATALQFPEYFGFNSAAFDECLTDLSWLNASGIYIGVVAAEELLRDESDEIGWLLQLLEGACKEWSEPIDEGGPWDRAAVPFHVVFHMANESSDSLPGQLAALPSLEQLPPSV